MPERSATKLRLGRAVKQIRVSRGLTQEQVSAASGLHPTYISDIERGVRNPTWEKMTQLAAGLDVEMSELARTFEEQSRSDGR